MSLVINHGVKIGLFIRMSGRNPFGWELDRFTTWGKGYVLSWGSKTRRLCGGLITSSIQGRKSQTLCRGVVGDDEVCTETERIVGTRTSVANSLSGFPKGITRVGTRSFCRFSYTEPGTRSPQVGITCTTHRHIGAVPGFFIGTRTWIVCVSLRSVCRKESVRSGLNVGTSNGNLLCVGPTDLSTPGRKAHAQMARTQDRDIRWVSFVRGSGRFSRTLT